MENVQGTNNDSVRYLYIYIYIYKLMTELKREKG